MDRMGWMNGWDGMGWDGMDGWYPVLNKLSLRKVHERYGGTSVMFQLIQLTFFQQVTTPGTHLMSLFLSRWKFKRRLATWRNLFPVRYPAWTSPRNTRKCLSCVRQNHFRQSCCYCLKPQGTPCNLIKDVSLKTVSFCSFNLQNKRLV